MYILKTSSRCQPNRTIQTIAILKSTPSKRNSRIIINRDCLIRSIRTRDQDQDRHIHRTFRFSLIRPSIHITRDIEMEDGMIGMMIDMIGMMEETDIGITINE